MLRLEHALAKDVVRALQPLIESKGQSKIIATDNPQGVIAEFRADEPLTPDMLGEIVRRIARP